MRLLDRYLLRELLIPFSYCFCGFILIWVSFDAFSEIGRFQSNKLTGLDIAEYYVAALPEMLPMFLPVALLLSLLYALTNHARHHELTAMRSAGVSLWRLSLPYLIVGFGCSIFIFLSNEIWARDSSGNVDAILNRYKKPAANADSAARLFFRNEIHNRIWTASGLYSLTLSNPHVEWHLPDKSRRDIYAESAVWTNGSWTFFKAQEWIYRSSGDTFPVVTQTNVLVRTEFIERPEFIKTEVKLNNISTDKAARRLEFSVSEILNYLHLNPNVSPQRAAMLATQLHGRIASAWTCLVVVLIAIPFGAPSGRRNVFVGVAASIFISFAYIILMRVGLTLGTAGHLPAWAAAWLPNIVFGTTGIVLISRVR